MTTNKQANVRKDLPNKKIFVERDFDASVEQVWRTWTEKELLDQWWAPKPWKAETKTMDFREGGMWLYAMVGPDATRIWARVDYKKIERHKSFTAVDAFCDENGVKNNDFPSMNWKNEFIKTSGGTKVNIEITFANETDLNKILEMGFEAGFTAALENLDELLLQTV
jgi:PhnB protein